MSVARLFRFPITAASLLFSGLVGWLLIAPLTLLIPRRKDWLVVIGMGGGRFVDNAKYFFLQGAPLLGPEMRVAFLTERSDTVAMLDGTGYETIVYPSPRAAWFLLRCSTVVIDSGDWLFHMRRFLLVGSRIVQLWHGAGFKRLGLDQMRHETSGKAWLSTRLFMGLRMINGVLNGKWVRYSAFVSSSSFYEREVFRNAFPSVHYVVAGYPRNTFGKLDARIRHLAWLNVDDAISGAMPSWQEQGKRIVLVMPTFRDSRATTLELDPQALETLDAYGEARGVEFVFKLHPVDRSATRIVGRHLHLCDPGSDIYPLMPLSHAMITDYSSAGMDYLLLDKPVLFFVPDLDEYVRRDRQLQFDFNEMTPGPKLTTWPQIVAALDEQWREDAFVAERARLKQLAFDGIDQRDAVPTLIAFMRARGWITNAARLPADV